MKKMFSREYSEYLYKNKTGEVWLKRPSITEWNNIKELIKSSTKISEEGDYKISETESVEYIKYIYDNLTSQSQETKNMDLEEFIVAISRIVYELKVREAISLYRKIEELLKDISEEIEYDIKNEIYLAKTNMNAIDIALESKILEEELGELLKKHNTDIDIDKLKELNNKKEELNIE